MSAVSLFSNCGAGDVGYREAGFDFEIMAELESQRLGVCLLNHPGAEGVPGDLRETWSEVITKWNERHQAPERPALLCACPPCQGMSSARSGMGHNRNPEHGARDARNLLVEVVAQVIAELQPRVVVLENVPQFLTKLVPHPETGRGISAPRLLQERVGHQYYFFPIVVDLADYGVPQTRKRTFITLIRRDEVWLNQLITAGLTPFPVTTHADNHVTFEQFFAAHPLPALDPRHTATATCPEDPLHAVGVWKPIKGIIDKRYEMTVATAQNGGSAWKNTACVSGCDNSQHPIGVNDALCPQCQQPLLRPVVQDKESKQWRLITGFRTSSYRRMRLNRVASTITTASGHIGSDINIHPTEPRLLSVRECALLQTFPQDFQWGTVLTNKYLNKIRIMIGEAVPPRFTEMHGEVLQRLLHHTGPLTPETMYGLMPATDVRHVRAMAKLGAGQQLDLDLLP